METIFLFDFSLIKTKDNREFIKTLMITNIDDAIHTYTSFGSAEGALLGMITIPDFRDHLVLRDITFVGKFNNQSRYAATLEFLDVDTNIQRVTVVYTQNY